ncbi:unnamed protein product [Phytophthora lilii]|uniref:Unnamed protein product n=1 Tax=Phytophthora lilii TaxID=2077276 RepID=A0A9W6TU34_9STRA|nr:unnamed protein product [Phytophthora lilii]
MLCLVALLGLQVLSTGVSAATYSVEAYFSDAVCTTGSAYQVNAVEAANCTAQSCSSDSAASSGDGSDAKLVECSSDFESIMATMLSGSSYVMIARFEGDNCSGWYYSYGTTQLGLCVRDKY